MPSETNPLTMLLVPSNPSMHVSGLTPAALSHVFRSELRSPVLLFLAGLCKTKTDVD